MKKNFLLILSIGMFLFILLISSASERASGGTGRDESVGIDAQNEAKQIGPPWFDEAWHYRRPVLITSSSSMGWYQVLIPLDNSNFNFTRAKPDGSDVRFTLSDGITELYYWIESWNSTAQTAYIWVRVTPLVSGNTTLYIYYNNTEASSHSNGVMTFDSFDDNWGQYPIGGFNESVEEQNIQSYTGISSLFNWDTISGSPTVSSGILSLVSGTGIKSKSTYQYQAVGFRAKFGLGLGKEMGGFFDVGTGQQTMIGDLPTDIDDLYLINKVTNSNTTILEGVSDWHNAFHIYEVRWKIGQSIGDIDHGDSHQSSIVQVPETFLPVTLSSDTGSNATLMVDWVYVRQYRDSEPTANLGTEQGLVDLGITMRDSPDPLPKNKELSYQITITNTSSIDAPGVVVTDTLPDSVDFIRANPSIGCNRIAKKVICNLNTINANSTANATVVVIPTADGVITNTVTVGSPGYELDLSNNDTKVTTTVDTDPPNVNWENPVHNGQPYKTNGGLVGFEASATDNDQVAWVEFWYWDHLPVINPRGKVSIGIDYSYPYQMQFNSDVLVPNEQYQMFVQAADRAGNVSSIYTSPSPVIYVKRISLYYFYLPVAIK
jgi:uncharacterized repeat protein (TIGR01451 family)